MPGMSSRPRRAPARATWRRPGGNPHPAPPLRSRPVARPLRTDAGSTGRRYARRDRPTRPPEDIAHAPRATPCAKRPRPSAAPRRQRSREKRRSPGIAVGASFTLDRSIRILSRCQSWVKAREGVAAMLLMASSLAAGRFAGFFCRYQPSSGQGRNSHLGAYRDGGRSGRGCRWQPVSRNATRKREGGDKSGVVPGIVDAAAQLTGCDRVDHRLAVPARSLDPRRRPAALDPADA